MSVQYDNYLTEHKENVAKGFRWLQENIPEVIEDGFEWRMMHISTGTIDPMR